MVNSTNFSDINSLRETGLATVIAGGTGYLGLRCLPKLDKKFLVGNPAKMFALNEEEKDIFIQKGRQIIDNSSLKDFGVKFELVDRDSKPPYTSQRFKKIFEAIKNKKNACYMGDNKTVYMNRDFLAPLFHELGHAKNHKDGFGPRMKNIRWLFGNKYLMLGMPALAVLTSAKKETPEKKLSKKDKAFNTARYCCGAFGGIGLAALLADEKMASVKGFRMAKESGLDKKLLKVVKRVNNWGFGSYCRNAFYYIAITAAAVKFKDYLLGHNSTDWKRHSF